VSARSWNLGRCHTAVAFLTCLTLQSKQTISHSKCSNALQGTPTWASPLQSQHSKRHPNPSRIPTHAAYTSKTGNPEPSLQLQLQSIQGHPCRPTHAPSISFLRPRMNESCPFLSQTVNVAPTYRSLHRIPVTALGLPALRHLS
jgi:hypothetical protein